MREPAGLDSGAGTAPDRICETFPDTSQRRVVAVAERVRAILGARTPSAAEAALLTEIEDLAATVATTRSEIAAMRADDITASHIPSATDELDAIVTHTATATNSILESCEDLEAMMVRLGREDAQTLQDAVTRIYEACSFQDITGQRITKIVAALQAIERKVAHMIGVFSPDGAGARVSRELTGPEQLLNGPQLPEAAMGQSDIDALLASFD